MRARSEAGSPSASSSSPNEASAVQTLAIRTDEARLTLEVGIKPEIRAAADTELPPGYVPADIGLLPGDAAEYIITSGGLKGQRGFFPRGENRAVVGIDLARS